MRDRWIDRKGQIYEFDRQHGTMEKYTKNGKHLGEFDVTTGKMLNGPIAGRKVDK